jgi:hypothetical protein
MHLPYQILHHIGCKDNANQDKNKTIPMIFLVRDAVFVGFLKAKVVKIGDNANKLVRFLQKHPIYVSATIPRITIKLQPKSFVFHCHFRHHSHIPLPQRDERVEEEV